MHIKDGCDEPCCISGDFNNVLGFNEKIRRPVLWSDIEDFRACVEYYEVVDVKGQGAFYTWNNKYEPQSRVFSRIDRCLVNADWMHKYPECYAYLLPEGLYNHNPCISYRKIVRQRKPHFRYFNMWRQDPNFKALMHSHWSKRVSGTTMYQVVTKLKNLKRPLKELNRNGYSNIEKAVGIAKVRLDTIQEQMHSDTRNMMILNEELEASKSYRELLLDFFKTGQLLKQLNTTTLTLIPKASNPVSVLEYRPIACYNIIYKSIEKILFSRLGEVLPDIVSSSQGAFIKGRNIVENVLIGQDLVRLYNRKAASPRCLIKIDLRKAYDTVEWVLVKQMLCAMQFSKRQKRRKARGTPFPLTFRPLYGILVLDHIDL
ncbi:uncharacterized protein LOC141637636 [Silene latifolia]|uniref:uncharacterized protein LOC141637636 n=1 Tax=Silene latifolia TaxID=37657 RepID=UPI003D76D9D9